MADFKEYRSAFLDRQDDLRHYHGTFTSYLKGRHKKRIPGAKSLPDENADQEELEQWKEDFYAKVRRAAFKKKAKERTENKKKR